jgi:2-polyprenyl-6-methoxyphenol hydroxylase-like FAD-dependent oxidoreductase
LVVVADGAGSVLRPAVTAPPRRRWTWTVWQACIAAEVPEIPAGAGAGIIAPGFFSGVWRLPGKRITWFVEQPKRQPGDGGQVLRDLADDEDPVLRTLARATAAEQWIEWRAEDVWPRRTLHRCNVVLVGDAAHAMLPTLGQGACQAIEDAAALVAAVAAEDHLEQALRRYEAARVPRVRRVMTLARAGAMSRRPSATSRASIAWAAGAIVSTANDLARFYSLLLAGRLLPAPLLRDMLQTVPTGSGGPGLGYGLGIFFQRLPCGTVWGHDGNFPGYSSDAFATRDDKRQVIVFINADSSTLSAQQSTDVSSAVSAGICAAG